MSNKEFTEAHWKIQTANLLNEMVNNNDKMAIFSQPVHILGVLLGQVADRAGQLNDKELNKLMLRLGLYEEANPESKNYMGGNELEEYLKS